MVPGAMIGSVSDHLRLMHHLTAIVDRLDILGCEVGDALALPRKSKLRGELAHLRSIADDVGSRPEIQ